MERQRYPSDLSDAQWQRLVPLLVKTSGRRGRTRTHPMREIVNGLLYLARTGCSWRQIPHDLPPWESIYDHFRRWKQNGKLEAIHARLREEVRLSQGREATPSVAIIDSQTVKTTEKGGLEVTMGPSVS